MIGSDQRAQGDVPVPIGRRAESTAAPVDPWEQRGRRGSSPPRLNEMDTTRPFLVTDCDEVVARLDAFDAGDAGRPTVLRAQVQRRPAGAVDARRGGAGFEIASVYELDPLDAIGVARATCCSATRSNPSSTFADGTGRGVAVRSRLRGRAAQDRRGRSGLGRLRAPQRRGLAQPVPALTQVRHVRRRGAATPAHGTRAAASARTV